MKKTILLFLMLCLYNIGYSQCLTSPNGQWPPATFVPDSGNCDGILVQTITTVGYAGEYSTVTVVSGQTYIFSSSIPSDIVTISADGGATAAIFGTGSVTWVATISGDIRFYTHTAGCGNNTNSRNRDLICGIPSTATPDYVNLQFPATASTTLGGTDVTIYAQVYEAGLTDVAPNITGQAPGITAWIGYSTTNTNPNTWTNWVPATWNAGHISNNDEYQTGLGSTLPAGTYYYASRFRLNNGPAVYGGLSNIWNGTSAPSGVLTVTPLLANDVCSGAVALTPGGVFDDYPINGTTLNASTGGPAPLCQPNSFKEVWYSVVVPASGSVTIETQVSATNSITDGILAAYTGTCNGTLTEVGCNDDGGPVGPNNLMSLMPLTGLTPASTIFVLVSLFGFAPATGDEFRVSAYDASLLAPTFDASTFAVYPNPVKDILNFSYVQTIDKVQVINILGQEVVAENLAATEGQLDFSSLAKGVYLVKITSNNLIKTYRVIKK